jgi:YHS domain-containing protein
MKLLLRILSLLFIFFLLRYLVRSIFVPPKPKSNPQPDAGNNPADTASRRIFQGRMEKDPVCGTYVDVASSLNLTQGKELVYFCSEECRQKFKAMPEPRDNQ